MDKIFSIALLLDESFLNISIKKAVPPKEIQFLYVIPLRFERKTHALEGRCSIQLSYGTILNCGAKVMLFVKYQKHFYTFFVSICPGKGYKPNGKPVKYHRINNKVQLINM